MDESEIISRFLDHNLNISPEAISTLRSGEDANAMVEAIIKNVVSMEVRPAVVTPEVIGTIKDTGINEEAPTVLDDNKEVVVKKPRRRTEASEVDSDLKILTDRDVTDKSFSKGTIEGFVSYFNDRYTRLSKILKERDQMKDVGEIERTKTGGSDGEVKVIGMVNDVRTTRKGHILIQLEDPSGTIASLVRKQDFELIRLTQALVKDEVIGVIGTMYKDLLMVNDLLFPDLPMGRAPKRSEDPVAAALISDIHIGSSEFIGDAFEKFIRWIRGELGSQKQKELAGKVKYLVIGGDLVDGVGIYPGQEEELTIKDIYKQYEALAADLSRVPDEVEIIISPGNHDAVRQAEPQPAIMEEFAPAFYEDPRIHMVGNPCYAQVHGVNIVTYHGRSLDDIISTIPDQSYQKPDEAMGYILQKRHLAPIYGGKVPMSPEKHDFMLLEDPPDILHSGHVHTVGVRPYRGTTIINSGTFQSQTSFQRKMNMKPHPGVIPVVDLQAHRTTLMRFM